MLSDIEAISMILPPLPKCVISAQQRSALAVKNMPDCRVYNDDLDHP